MVYESKPLTSMGGLSALFLAMLLGSLLAGCKTNPETMRPQTENLKTLYANLPPVPQGDQNEKPAGLGVLTLSTQGMTLGQLCREISRDFDVSIVVAEGLEKREVTVELEGVETAEALRLVGRRLGVKLAQVDNVFFLGEVERQDRAVLVRRVRRLGGDELAKAVEGLTTEQGNVATYPDGLLVVADQVGAVEQVIRFIRDLERTESTQWVVQLRVVSFSIDTAKEFGLDVVPAGDLAARVAFNSATAAAGAVTLDTRLDAVLSAAASNEGVKLVAMPAFILRDGSRASFARESAIPFESTNTETSTQSATVEQTRVEFTKVGFTAAVELREVSRDEARLEVTIDSSQVEASPNDVPQVAGEEYQTSCLIRSGGTYLVGSYNSERESKKRALGLFLGGETKKTERIVQVWATAWAISGGRSSASLEGAPIGEGIQQPTTTAKKPLPDPAKRPTMKKDFQVDAGSEI